MTFEVNGTRVTIRGDLALKKDKMSLKMMAKTWSDSDKGFLVELRGLNVDEQAHEDDRSYKTHICPDLSKNCQGSIVEFSKYLMGYHRRGLLIIE